MPSASAVSSCSATRKQASSSWRAVVCEIPGASIACLLLVVAIAVLVSSLQGYAVSLDGLRHQVDPHWQRGMSFVRIGLKWLQQVVANAGRSFRTWIPIPLRDLEPCIPSRGVQRRKQQPWFTRIELPPRPRPQQAQQPAVA